MGLKFQATGTFSELAELYSSAILCELVHVDFYKLDQVPCTTVFTISEDDLKRVGILKG
jgi:hypothetical protein